LHLALGQAAAQLNEPIGERGLAVIDVRDDRKVADPIHGIARVRPGGRRGIIAYPPTQPAPDASVAALAQAALKSPYADLARHPRRRVSNGFPETVCARGCAHTSPRDGLPACL